MTQKLRYIHVPILVTALAAVSQALDLTVPKSIKVGTETEITLANDLSAPNSNDTKADNYITVLQFTPPGGNDIGIRCHLVKSTPIATTSLNITIPPSTFPDNTEARILTRAFNSTGTSALATLGRVAESDDVAVTGGTAQWSAIETNKDAQVIADPDGVPCSAYDCVRQCNMKYYPNNADPYNDTAYVHTYYCTLTCPGVTIWGRGPSGQGRANSTGIQPPAGTQVGQSGGQSGGQGSATGGAQPSGSSTPGGKSAGSRVTAAGSTLGWMCLVGIGVVIQLSLL